MIKKLSIFIILVSAVILIYKLINPAQAEPVNTVVIPQAETDNVIITKDMILGKLQSKGQIISMQQEFSKEYIDIDDGLFGERQTRFKVEGTYKMGLEIKDVKVLHVEGEAVHIELPETKLISLEIPFDQITIDKLTGTFRRKMDSDEQKELYKVIEKNVRGEIVSDKEIQNQARLHNEQVVKEMLMDIAGVRYVVIR